jgi:uncharacterized phage protein (TIGR01671 family)
MNREIKFRTWDRQNKQFAEWTNRDPFFDTSSGRIFFWERVRREDGSYDGDIILQDFGDRFVLQQYTGLQDRDGKDIYEGDILEYQSSDSEFSTCIVRWTQEYEDNHPGFVITNNYSQYGKPKIIGNIFENPELIKTNE